MLGWFPFYYGELYGLYLKQMKDAANKEANLCKICGAYYRATNNPAITGQTDTGET